MYNLVGDLVNAGNSVKITKVEFLGGDVVITFIDTSGNIKTIKRLFSNNMILATNVVLN